MQDLDEARRALRERQGSGARYDSASAPARELAWAREGTAFFARALNELSDGALSEPSVLVGWNRAQVVAHVGYNARALTRLLTWAKTGRETPMYESTAQRSFEIQRGASLPGRALRHLVHHSAIHLDVEWRDLPDEAWDAQVRTAQGRTVPARETAWMRVREVWVHAVDLASGARFADLPPDLLDALVDDVFRSWEPRGDDPRILVIPTDRPPRAARGDGETVVEGRQADLARWLTGRGGNDVRSPSGALPELPRWL